MIIDCPRCKLHIEATAVCSYERFEPQEGPPARYSLLKCPQCEDPVLVVQEDYGGGWDEPLQLFPADLRANPNLPGPILSAHSEAIACLKARAYTAAAIMCRKTLEGLCAEHGIRDRNLVGSLQQMKDKGIIEQRLFEWADTLRISGNEAAHDLGVIISHDDAKDLLEFTNALLEYVFTFRERFERFKARRKGAEP